MSKSREYLERLAAMNRGPLQNAPAEPASDAAVDDLRRKLRLERAAAAPPPAAPPGAIQYRRNLPSVGTAPSLRPTSASPVALDEAISGSVVEHAPWGRAFVRTARSHELCRYGSEVARAFRERCCRPDAPVMNRLAAIGAADRVTPEEVVFLDLETAGLANAPVFLVGLMAYQGGDLVVSQYFARDYAEEAAITAMFVGALAGKRVLVSFNGKSFDMPYMRVRAAASGVPFCEEPGHLDLLHESRRAWRGQVPDCKLQTLERWICGRFRHGDIPSAEVPEAYHAFVRTGDATEIARVLDHNGRDLLTLAEILVKIPDAHWAGAEG